MTNIITRTGICSVVFFMSYLLPFQTAYAALLYFDPGEAEVNRGDTITISLRIDTDEDECVNAVDAVVNYDSSIRAVDVSRGDSILSIWVENPNINETDHTITFAGGIPGGYCGRIPGDPSLTNVIAKIVLRSPGFNVGSGKAKTARVWLGDETQVLLNDGLGTNAGLRFQDTTIHLLDTAGTVIDDEWNKKVSEDKDLPSDFSITLTKDESAFSNQYFIVFNSIDKQSGIDHYEIIEEPISDLNKFRWGRADAPWVRAESPYVLKDQSLNSTIRVKAIDKAGNERIAVLIPDPALRSLSYDARITMIVVTAAVLLFISLVIYALWRRKKAVINNRIELHEEL